MLDPVVISAGELREWAAVEATAGRKQAGTLWATAGVLWAIAVLGIASIGLFVMPVAVLATCVAGVRTGGRGLRALAVAAVVVIASLLTFQAVTAERESGGGSSIAPRSSGS